MLEIETRRLGKTELRPKALGLGCGFIGNPWTTSEQEAIATIRHAIEHGVNFIDTAAGYGKGFCEHRVGLALLNGWREKVYLQTKLGSHPNWWRDYSEEAARWTLENSFRQLKTDYIDSVLIHEGSPDIDAPFRTSACLDVLLEWKEKGRIGHVGIGVREHQYHKRAIESGCMEIVLSYLDYTLLAQSAAETVIPWARSQDIGIILAGVLATGLLAGMKPDSNLEIKESPGRKPRSLKMWEWCRDRGVNIRDLAMQFVLAAPLEGNGIVLVGPANREEFDGVYKSAISEVSEVHWRDFEAEFGIGLKNTHHD